MFARLSIPVLLVTLFLPLGSHAALYFVAPDGSDVSPGTSELPFRTVAKGTSVLVAGDTLTIRPGTYSETSFILGVGTSDQPITVQAEDGVVFTSPDPTGHAEAFNIGSNARYVRLLGIEATGGFGEAVLVRPGAQNVEIRNCRLHGNRVGLTINGASQILVSDCLLYENVRAGLRIAGGSHDVNVVDTDAYRNSDGLGCAGEGDGFVSDDSSNFNLSFVRTRSYDNSEDAYDAKGANLVFDQIESRSSCNGFKLGNSASITNSLITGGHVGIETIAVVPGVTYNILHCTLVGSEFPIFLDRPLSPVASYTVNLFNNIVVGPNRALDYYYTGVDLFEGHNIFWNGNPAANIIKVVPNQGRFTGNDINSGVYTTTTGRGAGTFVIDPRFVDAAGGDFTPDPSSAAIDRADTPWAPLVDLTGNPRPMGIGADIGAIESPMSVANHEPQAGIRPLRRRISRTGRVVQFDATPSFDPDGDALTYTWDFGDSMVGDGVLPVHIFALPGVYTVQLTVSDGSLENSSSMLVTVKGRPPRPTKTPRPPTLTPTPTATPTAP